MKTLTSSYLLCLFISVCCLPGVADSLNNGLALKPPMGWMHWERFRCLTDCTLYPKDCLTEDLIKSQVDALVAEGYRDVGYEYVSVDDCWMAKERDSNDSLLPDPKRFPSGIKSLADYVHSKGLKLGIYADIGTLTCQKYPGSEKYLEKDAKTFAEWGVDLLKLDGCNSNTLMMRERYENMGKYLNATGRPILYLCSWPAYVNKNPFLTDYAAFRRTCNQWRNYDDIQDSWESLYSIITYYGDNVYDMSEYNGPGGWNDPDELIVGNFGLSIDQERVQMGMWAMMASPLFMSLDLRKVNPESKLLLQNRTLISINQDRHGIMGKRIWKYSYGLIVGNFGLSIDQERVQMGMWAMMASPLFMSLDLRNVNPESKLLLQNRTLITINQDRQGIMGKRIWKYSYGLRYLEGWVKPLSKKGSAAIAIINSDTGGAPVMLKKSLSDFGFTSSKYSLTDVLYTESNSHPGIYAANDTIVFRINPTGIYLGIVQMVGW